MKKTLAMSIRCRDDLDCLKENIEYHTLIGVEHFFIHDHMSTIPLKSALADYDNVTVKLCKTVTEMLTCHDKCWDENKNKFQWIAIIDTDEFFVMKDGNTDLKEFLKPYEKYGSLAVWWRCFNSSGHKKKPPNVIHGYTHATQYGGPSYKHFFNTKFVVGPADVPGHKCQYRGEHFGVHADFSKIKEEHRPNEKPGWKKLYASMDEEKIQLNHYIVRSVQDFEEKIARYKEEPSSHGAHLALGPYWKHHNRKMPKETSIIEFLDLIKRKNKND